MGLLTKWFVRASMAVCVVLMNVACEQTIDADLPYDKLVVMNVFVGRDVDSLAWISRTLPATDQATYDDVKIMDAAVTMHWRDTVYTLTPDTSRNGFLLPRPDARWNGDSLTMVVEWDGIRAESRARMPQLPTIVKLEVVPKEGDPEYRSLVTTLRVRPGCVVWFEDSRIGRSITDPPLAMYNSYRLIPGNPNDPEVEVTFKTGDNYYLFPGGTMQVMINCADAAYARFLDEPNRGSDNPFGFGGARTYSNVRGSGIGMFVPVISVEAEVEVE